MSSGGALRGGVCCPSQPEGKFSMASVSRIGPKAPGPTLDAGAQIPKPKYASAKPVAQSSEPRAQNPEPRAQSVKPQSPKAPKPQSLKAPKPKLEFPSARAGQSRREASPACDRSRPPVAARSAACSRCALRSFPDLPSHRPLPPAGRRLVQTCIPGSVGTRSASLAY